MSLLELDYPPDLLDQLRHIRVEPYLAVLMRVARVNEVSVAERDLAVLLGVTLGATEEATMEALRLADSDRSLAALIEELPAGLRPCLYRDACRMAWADGSVDAGENRLLQDLAGELGLQAARSENIRELTGQLARAQHALLRELEED